MVENNDTEADFPERKSYETAKLYTEIILQYFPANFLWRFPPISLTPQRKIKKSDGPL